jgi:hypothetical protein
VMYLKRKFQTLYVSDKTIAAEEQGGFHWNNTFHWSYQNLELSVISFVNPAQAVFGHLLVIQKETPDFSQHWYRRRKAKQQLLCSVLWNQCLVNGTHCGWTTSTTCYGYEMRKVKTKWVLDYNQNLIGVDLKY